MRHRKGEQNEPVPAKSEKSEQDKATSTDDSSGASVNSPSDQPQEPRQTQTTNSSGWPSLWQSLYCIVGLLVALMMGCAHAYFMSQLHENQMYFTRIETVEREISFRTETGLFYSYFKQLVEAKSLDKGIHQLMYDNMTEHGHTINVMERMNIHQEVLLGILFRTFRVPLLINTEPVYFYLNAVWSLQAMYVVAIFCTVWVLTGGWAGGVLSVLLFTINRQDTTRVWFSMPLRESFSIPFIFAQLLFVTIYFKRRSSIPHEILLAAITICTFCLSVTWQFAQFVLLLQAFALYSSQALQLVPTHKVRNVMMVQLLCLAAVCLLQFGNTLIPRSLVISFILGSLIVFTIQGEDGLRSRSFIGNFGKLVGYTLLTFAVAAVANVTIKALIAEEADRHIYNFVRAKLGLSSPWADRDFDVLLYICDPSFKGLPHEVWQDLLRNFLLVPYAGSAAVLLILLTISVLANWWAQSHPSKVKCDDARDDDASADDTGSGSGWLLGRPDIAYHLLYTCFFGFVAFTTLRFKYLWTPHMCILAAVGVSDAQLYQWLLSRVGVKSEKAARVLQHLVVLAMAGFLVYTYLPIISEELGYLGEFYDPDTVALMKWITKSTRTTAAFAGSMQLMAGVKLCTGHPIANHPHYEDRRLRERTWEIYQIYGKQPAELVHRNLRKYGIDYIILEKSICYAHNDERWPGCRLPDIMDRCNGHTLDFPDGQHNETLVPSEHGRFCDEVQADDSYKKYFRSSFSNKTFRVFKVLNLSSDK
ncbi:protein C-mannosyl-transferase DPY19L3-like [Sycon ciliatum]|uniref:protein C-mannosyl-transferase DPY19L3-like n=1 Tax=Sycon ciliatum TaxID=27933 RepID=UPI0031F6C62C